jgi:hypothetical protein
MLTFKKMAVVRIFKVMPDKLKEMEAVIADIPRNSLYFGHLGCDIMLSGR